METCVIPISMVVSECSPSKYCDKNQRKIYFLSSYFLYYMHLKKIFGCYTLVTTRLLILEWFLRTHPCDCWVFEVQNTTCAIMENQVKSLSDSFDLLDKVMSM